MRLQNANFQLRRRAARADIVAAAIAGPIRCRFCAAAVAMRAAVGLIGQNVASAALADVSM